MQLISCHAGKLVRLCSPQATITSRSFPTHLPAVDALLPGGTMVCAAVHEILYAPSDGPALFFALLLAGAATPIANPKPIVFCDPHHLLYPPALAMAGVSLDQLLLLHPKDSAQEIWALAQCLACKAVGVTIAAVGRLTAIQARRLQLAAEHGGGIGILLRPLSATNSNYAAATRWLVQPTTGTPTLQRWKIQLIHGHGGRIRQTVILEYCRETHHVRAATELADRSAQPQALRASA